MKKTTEKVMCYTSLVTFLLFAVALAGLTACKSDPADPPFLEVVETELGFAAEGGSLPVEVRSNRTFTAVSGQPEWCVVAVGEGETQQLQVTVAANSGETERTATVTVSVDDVTPVEVKITQSLRARITIPAEYVSLEFPGNTGGLRSIPVQTTGNRPVSATSSQAWCQVAVSGFMVNVNVETNAPGAQPRSGEVIISGDGMESVTIPVRQSAFAGYVTIAEEHLTHRVKGETNTSVYASVSHNVPYTVTSDQPWCTVATFVDEAKHHIKIAVSRNGTGAARTARITVAGGAEPIAVTLTQDAAAHQAGYPRFAVLSDTHFNNREGGGESSEVKVPRALKNLTGHGDLDAIFVVGDITDHGQEDEYDNLLAAFADPANVPPHVPVYYLMGNHDDYSGGEMLYLARTRQPMNQYLEIRGYPFITVSMTGSTAWDYNHAAQRFLSESLADAAATYPGKPIFVFTHMPSQNTVNSGGGASALPPLLEPYPQVIIFSGHSHSPLGDPRSIWQGGYTAVNDGSTNYASVSDGSGRAEGYNRVTEGIIVTVKEDGAAVELERRDTRRDEEILPRWTVRAPYDGSNFANEYKGRDGLPAPVFAADAADRVTTSFADGTLTVTFPQATDNDRVRTYTVSLLNAENDNVLQSSECFSQHYLNSEMPASLTVRFTNVPAAGRLKIRITAVDTFGNRSETPVSYLIEN
jgi:predicted phosphodiesterase